MDKITKDLFKLRDLEYARFHSRLIPEIDSDRVIGVRTPILRQYAKDICKEKCARVFLEELPHKYYEENNLHGELIAILFSKDFDATIRYLDEFLPYVDNWATCDLMSFKIYKKYPEKVYENIKRWIKDERVFVKRYGIVTLIKFLEDDLFKEEMHKLVANIQSEEYYINMARAWYFSIAFVKQYDATIPYFKHQLMDRWTHNKSIQKAIESKQIDLSTKEYLRTLKIK